MPKQAVEKDERSVAVDNAAGNQAYKVMTWLVVIDMGLHGRTALIDWNGFPVDLVAIIAGGLLTWTWQAWRNQIIPRSQLLRMGLAMLAAAGVAALISFFR